MSEPPSIRIRPDGPYVLTGLAVRRMHAERAGEPVGWVTEPDLPVPRKEGKPATAVLCRCGRSARKPFCDGSHRGVFEGTETAPDTTFDAAARAQLIAIAQRCPSGALTDRTSGAEQDTEPDRPAAVGVIDDGPLWVTGSVPLQLSDGRMAETRARVALCRCGHSANKPYCDGTHAEIGFRDS